MSAKDGSDSGIKRERERGKCGEREAGADANPEQRLGASAGDAHLGQHGLVHLQQRAPIDLMF